MAIARAVMAGAKILFLDEPLAGLDQHGINDCLSLLESLVREQNLTLVIVEHVLNQPQLRPLVTKVWRLERGRLSKEQACDGAELARPSARLIRPKWMEQLATDGAVFVDHPLPQGAVFTRIQFRGQFDSSTNPALELKNVVIDRGKRTIVGFDDAGHIDGMDLVLQPGEIGVLQAPNGWGKTTLFRAIAGLHPLTTGSVWMEGAELTHCPPWARSRMGLRMSLGAAYLFDTLTVRETLELSGADVSTCPRSDFLSKRVSELSGGQRQMLSLRAGVGRPASVTLFDEPFSQVDASNNERAMALIRSRRHSCVLIAVPLKTETGE